MRSLNLDSDQHRFVTTLRPLQRRRELERVAGDDAIVVVCGGNQGRRIAGARFHVLRGPQKLHILLTRDGLAEGKPVSFDDTLATLQFNVENRSATAHQTEVRLSGLPAGSYLRQVGNAVAQQLSVQEGQTVLLRLPIGAAGARVTIRRIAAKARPDAN